MPDDFLALSPEDIEGIEVFSGPRPKRMVDLRPRAGASAAHKIRFPGGQLHVFIPITKAGDGVGTACLRQR